MVVAGPSPEVTSFGLTTALGFLVSRHLEPAFTMGVLYQSSGQVWVTALNLTPSLKVNTWVRRSVNPFFEPYAGYAVADGARAFHFLRLGVAVGVELLVGYVGVRLWTGLDATIGEGGAANTYGVPLRWALVAYL